MPMLKLTAADPEAKSAELIAENIAQLKALFPELVTEGPQGASVNVDVLKAVVGDGDRCRGEVWLELARQAPRAPVGADAVVGDAAALSRGERGLGDDAEFDD